MSRSNRGPRPDAEVDRILDALKDYDDAHAEAQIVAYRQNSISIRVRIIDPSLGGLDRIERENRVWTILEKLPADIRSDITLLLLLTPEEARVSFVNFEFENPLPSRL